MHGHDTLPIPNLVGMLGVLPAVGLFLTVVLFYAGILPIPIGYERGKVKWVTWCGTGMHVHVVFWHREEDGRTDRPGFQSIHPLDVSEGGE